MFRANQVLCLVLLIHVPVMALGQSETPVPNTTGRAIENEVRIWRALTGDTMELDGRVIRLAGVTCPGIDTEEGRKAKALLNTFLRAGRISCQVSQSANGPEAVCRKEQRDFAEGMRSSGLCE